MIVYLIASIPVIWFLLRVRKVQARRAFADRPYRYQSDVRRSRWSHTKGF